MCYSSQMLLFLHYVTVDFHKDLILRMNVGFHLFMKNNVINPHIYMHV